MGQMINDRVCNLERIALEFEGAQFATRHLLANLLARLDRNDAEECLRDLQRVGRAQGVELGDARLTGYLDELDAIRFAVRGSNIKAAPPLRVVS